MTAYLPYVSSLCFTYSSFLRGGRSFKKSASNKSYTETKKEKKILVKSVYANRGLTGEFYGQIIGPNIC